ncbi:hypothetical protein CEXT_538251 [Caerostris extrusa]|uniref:Uncharacterized protein n=1 Tax=Caerostris extrusa TaxID=172846 RepID=A0AAV4XBC3_CAEEX|nr:hypothetical protein CEXT_538251 [Caerostris extrusa]
MTETMERKKCDFLCTSPTKAEFWQLMDALRVQPSPISRAELRCQRWPWEEARNRLSKHGAENNEFVSLSSNNKSSQLTEKTSAAHGRARDLLLF